jgi:hypothetical protein
MASVKYNNGECSIYFRYDENKEMQIIEEVRNTLLR